jgi:hypothetical protein
MLFQSTRENKEGDKINGQHLVSEGYRLSLQPPLKCVINFYRCAIFTSSFPAFRFPFAEAGGLS